VTLCDITAVHVTAAKGLEIGTTTKSCSDSGIVQSAETSDTYGSVIVHGDTTKTGNCCVEVLVHIGSVNAPSSRIEKCVFVNGWIRVWNPKVFEPQSESSANTRKNFPSLYLHSFPRFEL
tara:strand:- start:2671 stop:3030 length:360 start_codon:yes stop_codon:yes gene_type:complete